MANETDNPLEDAPARYRYSRAQALMDGALVDVSTQATACGFRLPCAVTCNLWARMVPVQVLRERGESEDERLREMFKQLRAAIGRLRVAGQPSDRVSFRLTLLMPSDRQVPIRLVAVCGPADDAEPVITVMLEGED